MVLKLLAKAGVRSSLLPVGIVLLGGPFVRSGTEKAHGLVKSVLQRRALGRPGD